MPSHFETLSNLACKALPLSIQFWVPLDHIGNTEANVPTKYNQNHGLDHMSPLTKPHHNHRHLYIYLKTG